MIFMNPNHNADYFSYLVELYKAEPNEFVKNKMKKTILNIAELYADDLD